MGVLLHEMVLMHARPSMACMSTISAACLTWKLPVTSSHAVHCHPRRADPVRSAGRTPVQQNIAVSVQSRWLCDWTQRDDCYIRVQSPDASHQTTARGQGKGNENRIRSPDASHQITARGEVEGDISAYPLQVGAIGADIREGGHPPVVAGHLKVLACMQPHSIKSPAWSMHGAVGGPVVPRFRV